VKRKKIDRKKERNKERKKNKQMPAWSIAGANLRKISSHKGDIHGSAKCLWRAGRTRGPGA